MQKNVTQNLSQQIGILGFTYSKKIPGNKNRLKTKNLVHNNAASFSACYKLVLSLSLRKLKNKTKFGAKK